MTTRTYPAHPSELTPEWLTTQLRTAGVLGDGSVTGFTTTPVGEGIGMLGILVRAALTYDRPAPDSPASIIAKFATPIEGNRAVALHFKLYEREVRFYRAIAPKVTARAPRCYGAEIDPINGDCVVLLEDLSAYRTGDQVEGCSAAQAKEIIEAVAPLHASFWGKVDDTDLDWVPHIDGDRQIEGMTGGCVAGWDPAIAQFGGVIAEEIKAAKDRFLPAVPELHRMMGRRTQTLIHGDVRLDNLMFGTNSNQHPVVLLDWSMTVSSGLHDIAYLLSQNVTTAERRAHEKALLEHYRAQLAEQGVDYPMDKIWDDYRVAVLYLFTYAIVIAGTLDPSNERGSAFMRELMARASATVVDHDLLTLLPA